MRRTVENAIENIILKLELYGLFGLTARSRARRKAMAAKSAILYHHARINHHKQALRLIYDCYPLQLERELLRRARSNRPNASTRRKKR